MNNRRTQAITTPHTPPPPSGHFRENRGDASLNETTSGLSNWHTFLFYWRSRGGEWGAREHTQVIRACEKTNQTEWRNESGLKNHHERARIHYIAGYTIASIRSKYLEGLKAQEWNTFQNFEECLEKGSPFLFWSHSTQVEIVYS